MRQLPKFTYKGLTVVLSNPSRMDLKSNRLLDGYAGAFFNDECLRPELNRLQCDIRTSDTQGEGLLDGTKAILLLGHRAMVEWTIGYNEYSLSDQRGCPLQNKYNLPCISSFTPQDCCDLVNWESKHNPEVIEYEEEIANEKEDETGKTKGGTDRSNYRFWLIRDTKKILKRLSCEVSGTTERPFRESRIYPTSEEVIEILTLTKNDNLYVDIETDSQFQINCIGFSFEHSDTFVVPVCRYNYTHAYGNLHEILKALATSFQHNTIVCHNSLFDLLILAWKYHVPIGSKNYDTMLAWHRCFPEAEKSLGHVMSTLTWEPYHKDEGIFQPKNVQQERKLWEYNAKDVYGTRLIRQAIDSYAVTQPGLIESISQSNDCIRPYLINTLQGIRYDNDKLMKMLNENDRKCMQYTRMINLLLGKDLVKMIQAKSHASLAASPNQSVKYFHDIMRYKSVGKTKGGKDSLVADNLYRLKLKYPENVVIDLILAYRERAKESGSLKFNPWLI